jgi:hypothetical protein
MFTHKGGLTMSALVECLRDKNEDHLYGEIIEELERLERELDRTGKLASKNGRALLQARGQRDKALEALKALMPHVPIGYASTGRPGASEDRNAKLQQALEMAREALATRQEHG